jgi:hypothetical protein
MASNFKSDHLGLDELDESIRSLQSSRWKQFGTVTRPENCNTAQESKKQVVGSKTV